MSIDVQTTPRRRLFQRQKTEARELTPRELALLGHIARHRFLASADLALLDGGSHQNVLRILRELFDLELVERPTTQVAHWVLSGPRPMIYGLTNKGARLLHGRQGGENTLDDVRTSERNRRAGALFIQHTVGISRFMAHLEAASQADGKTTVIPFADILAEAPEPTRALREPRRIKGREESGGRLPSSVIPDEIFALGFPDDTAAYFFLELDRGTMPVRRKGQDRTSFGRKIGIYLDAWKAGVFEQQFGVRHWQILTVTPSRERIATMIDAVKDFTAGKGSGLFLFVDEKTLAASDPLSVAWVNGKGETVRLAD